MSYAVIFRRVGETKTGRGLYKLVHKDGHVFGRAFTIDGKTKRAAGEKP